MQGADEAPSGGGEREAAWLARLGVKDFRNFDQLEVQLPPEGVAIVGPNGSGKTNLLEAIYYLEIFRSFRGAADRELIRFGQDVFRVEATVRTDGASRELAAAYEGSGRRKKVEVDRREVDRLSDAIGTLGAVVFSLDDVEIVRGAPGERRRFLDILLSLVEPGYVGALQRYRSVLSQRNEALRESGDPSLLDAWTEGLVETGATVMAARARWLEERSEAFGRYHRIVAGGDRATMSYEPSVGKDAVAEAPGPRASREDRESHWGERFRSALAASRGRERRREVTVVGPHRDEVGFRAQVTGDEERDLRTYGSGGQNRTAALALRLVEADSLHDRLDREPIYLMDDMFAELDRRRSRRLLELLEDGRSGQVVVTAPKPSEVELRGGGLETWRIEDGKLET
ncbi:MAG: DNA replication/repair protein RecF [Gemmatimonadota bacterium]